MNTDQLQMKTDPVILDTFEQLKSKWNQRAYHLKKRIPYENKKFFEKMKDSVNSDRFGEVVFAVLRPNGKVITVTCEAYPEGIFRIPTGGISYGEDVEAALYREVHEELGITSEIAAFAGLIEITFAHEAENVPFYSFIFILKETGGRLLEDATDDEVSEIKEADVPELIKISEKLLTIQSDWSDWGKFRYCTTRAIADELRMECITG